MVEGYVTQTNKSNEKMNQQLLKAKDRVNNIAQKTRTFQTEVRILIDDDKAGETGKTDVAAKKARQRQQTKDLLTQMKGLSRMITHESAQHNEQY